MKWKKCVGILLTAVVSCVLLAQSAFVLIPTVLGMRCCAVISASMEPAIPVGALVLVEPIAFDEIQEQDVLTFTSRDGRDFFTHRVVQIDETYRLLYTKGDANNHQDPLPASYEYVVGRVVKTIPGLGYVRILFSSSYVIAGTGLFLFIYLTAVCIRRIRLKKAQINQTESNES